MLGRPCAKFISFCFKGRVGGGGGERQETDRQTDRQTDRPSQTRRGRKSCLENTRHPHHFVHLARSKVGLVLRRNDISLKGRHSVLMKFCLFFSFLTKLGNGQKVSQPSQLEKGSQRSEGRKGGRVVILRVALANFLSSRSTW